MPDFRIDAMRAGLEAPDRASCVLKRRIFYHAWFTLPRRPGGGSHNQGGRRPASVHSKTSTPTLRRPASGRPRRRRSFLALALRIVKRRGAGGRPAPARPRRPRARAGGGGGGGPARRARPRPPPPPPPGGGGDPPPPSSTAG